ncbi:MAG: glycosyltransferase [Thermoleophilaceae bacterium]
MLASIIVPAHDAATTLPRTLAGLAAQEVDGEFEVIVVDDGSSDRTGALAEEAGVHVVRHERPLGPGASRNAGVAAAGSGVLAFTDADCAPTPRWLAAGLAALGDSGLVQGRVEPRPDVPCGPYDKTLWVTSAWGLFESANLFVRREVFESVGGFDDGLLELAGAHFGEDVVFGWRARRAGVATGFSEEALVHHEVFPRSAAEFVRERRRNALFAALVREVPELREAFFYRRWFLSERSARFALAAAGALAGAATRRPAIAAAAALPYAQIVRRELRGYGPRGAVARIAADGVGFAALVRGSVRARRIVL